MNAGRSGAGAGDARVAFQRIAPGAKFKSAANEKAVLFLTLEFEFI